MPHSQTHQEGAFDLISYEIRFGACFVELRKGNTKAKKKKNISEAVLKILTNCIPLIIIKKQKYSD